MRKKLGILLLIGLFSPLVVNAAEVVLDCPVTAKKGEDIACTIKVNSSETVDGVQASISVSDGLTHKSFSKNEGWDGKSSSSTLMVYGKSVTGEDLLGTYTYTVGNSAIGNLTVTLSDIKVSDPDASPITSNKTVSNTIKVLSDVNTLKELTVKDETLNFSSDKTTYDLTVDKESIEVNASATDSNAKVEGTGIKNLEYGSNKIVITVTSETGDKKEYTLNVAREDNRSTNNNLKSLSLSNGKITFKKDTTTYNITVKEDVESITIEAETEDAKATFAENFGPRTVNLQYGSNKVQVKVKSEKGEEKVYTINIKREGENTPVGAEKDDNASLKEITLSKGLLEFLSSTTEYELELPYTVEELEVNAVASSSKAKVEGTGTIQLEVGTNKIEIKVTAENGDIKVYTLNVKRLEDTGVELSDNNYLSSLVIKDYEINFKKNIKGYEIIIKDETSLEITATKEDEKAKVTITGNEDLTDGSEINILVVAENGDVRTYTINVKVQEESNSMMIIAIIIFLTGLISFTSVLISKLRKKSN